MSTPSTDSEHQIRLRQALQALKKVRQELDTLTQTAREAIAITGMACRFPDHVDTPQAFWELLHSGRDGIIEIPSDRWEVDAWYDPDPDAAGKMYTRHGGFFGHLKQFDAEFFGLSPKEAIMLDPQQRTLLEVTWEALENAAIPASRLKDSLSGVFVGLCTSDYLRLMAGQEVDTYMATGNAASVAAGRLSFFFGLKGPCLAVDTACSSSLVTVHLACQSLRAGECNLALAGGVNRILAPETTINFSKTRMLAPDGRCKTFDAAANGYVRSEGCGMVVLKRLSDAIKDRNSVLAVIRGSAVNQDGRSGGLTVPNGPSQQDVIRQALKNASLPPEAVSYIEAHGTGTALGDPIEIASLGAVFGSRRPPEKPLIVGSVKTSIGHLEAAAGIAGLMKVILCLQHQEIVPHLHFKTPNPHIAWADLPLTVPATPQPWKAGSQKRVAGISSFGFSGTNAHVILEDFQPDEVAPGESAPPMRPWHLLALSAKTPAALQALIRRYADFLTEHPDVALADVCHTANTGRTHFPFRLALTAQSGADMREQLLARASSPIPDPLATPAPRIAFLFTDLFGELNRDYRSELPDQALSLMIQQLADNHPPLRAALEDCRRLAASHLGREVAEGLFNPAAPMAWQQNTLFRAMEFYGLQYALCELWRSWGIVPTLLVGIGTGEYIAACAAGGLTLASAFQLLAARLQMTESIEGQPNPPAVNLLAEVARQISYSRPHTAILSSVSGKLAGEDLAAAWWPPPSAAPLAPSRLVTGLQEQGCNTVLTIGPRGSISETASQPESMMVLPPLDLTPASWPGLLASAAALYERGVNLDWDSFDQPYRKQLYLSLPTYPFQRQHYWIDQTVPITPSVQAALAAARTLTPSDIRQLARLLETSEHFSEEKRTRLLEILKALSPPTLRDSQSELASDCCYCPAWHPLTLNSKPQPTPSPSWLILADTPGLGAALARRLDTDKQSVLLVYAGEARHTPEAGPWTINPDQADDFQYLARELSGWQSPARILHLWSLNSPGPPHLNASELTRAQRSGCDSVLLLTQAVLQQHFNTRPRMWIITQGAVVTGQHATPLNPAQAPVWGLGRVIALEHSDVWGGLIDVEAPDSSIDLLLAAIDHAAPAPQIALRQGQAWEARLTPLAFESGFEPGLQSGFESGPALHLHPQAGYLITGGLGALGLRLARWMGTQGARHLALLGRHPTLNPHARETLQALKASGIQVQLLSADVADEAALAEALEQLRRSQPPLRGLIHAAGVLDDGMLLQQTPARFQNVLRPKVQGAWNLHYHTRHLELDFFVCFSSAVSQIGSPGQGNYAAANAFLDVLAAWRRLEGQPGLSINWGPWAANGMAASLDSRDYQRLLARGIRPLEPEQGLTVLTQLLSSPCGPQVLVMPADWSALNRSYGGQQQAFLAELLQPAAETPDSTGAAATAEFCRELEATPLAERRARLMAFIQAQTAAVLGHQRDYVPHAELGFFDLGMDSLMAVELKNRLEQALNRTLPSTLTFEYSTVSALSDYILELLFSASDVATPVPHGAPDGTAEAPSVTEPHLAEHLETLSEAEAEALLMKKLAGIEV